MAFFGHGTTFESAQHLAALSQSALQLQHINIEMVTINFLPMIVEHFPELKTLILENIFHEEYIGNVPSRQNLCLE